MAGMGRSSWRLVGNDDSELMQQPLSCKRGEPTWYPLIPRGTFQYTDPQTGEPFRFSVTDEVLTEMVSHLKGPQRAYGGHGIPCDQDNRHSGYDDPDYALPVDEDGADLWANDLDVREDGLWALVEPTAKGEPKMESRPYLSPVFTAGDGVDPKYGLRNFIRNLTLVSQPWFWPQPGLMVAASMSTLPQGNSEQSEGGIPMSEQATAIAELEQKLQDAEARAIEAETKAAEAEARITELEGEITLRDEQITELQGRAEAAETANADLAKRIEAIEATLAEKTREAALGEKVNEILGQVHEEVIPLDGGGYATEHRAPTQEYAVVAASAFVKGDPDSVQALNVFLADNGGRIPTRNVSDKPNLQVIPASANAGGSAAPQTDDEKLAVALQGQEFTAQRGKQIKTLMDGGMPFEQARRKAMASS